MNAYSQGQRSELLPKLYLERKCVDGDSYKSTVNKTTKNISKYYKKRF